MWNTHIYTLWNFGRQRFVVLQNALDLINNTNHNLSSCLFVCQIWLQLVLRHRLAAPDLPRQLMALKLWREVRNWDEEKINTLPELDVLKNNNNNFSAKQCSFSCTESKNDERKEKELPGLDHFLAKNTSEDCASFEHIMEMADDKEKLRHAWLYEAEAEFKQVCIGKAQAKSSRCLVVFQYACVKFVWSFRG